MKKLLLAGLFIGGSMFSKATTHAVTISGFTFSPSTINAAIGDTVAWVLTGVHTATEVDLATWTANGNTPLSGGFNFNASHTTAGTSFIVLTSAGQRYWVCSPHASMGMKGQINTVAVGTDEISNEVSLNIYPNPVTETLYLTVNNALETPVSLEIINVLGKKVIDLGGKQVLTGDTRKIDVSALPRGVYFLNLVADTRIRSIRFVKK
ncbi:MAG TPA: T9SS type A sorting domain-containing protein [Flavobacteriales bacterium]|nr:T9SS type A sorting domain-containing protein [Flavobacteriales bacterium]